ncbi:MAG TPA: hypothetical protein VKU00_21650 [Chthonomonadaceae bacterium]|nr:hypothetical protein [Chthonomonadaceae bacterium]
MPQPRKYANRAEQQAAYRQRRIVSDRELLAQKGLPALPAIPTMPGNARWSAMIAQAHLLLSEAVVEMQDYHDDRSEPWQESTKAQDLLAKLEHLQETMDQLQGIE